MSLISALGKICRGGGGLKNENPQKKWNPPALPLEAIPWFDNGHHWHKLHMECYTSYVRVILPWIVQHQKPQLHSTEKTWLFSSVPKRLGHTWIHNVHERYDTTGFETANPCSCNWLHKLKCTWLKLEQCTTGKWKGGDMEWIGFQ